LVAANRTEEALIPLKDAVAEEITVGEYGRARELADLRNSILDTFPIDPDGIHALSTEITQVYLADLATRKALLHSRGEILIAWAERLEEWDAMSQIRLSLAGTILIDGDNKKAEQMYKEALDIAQRHNLPREVEILNRLCFYCIRTGDITGAIDYARQAGLAAESRGDSVGVGNAYTMLSRVHRQIGQIEAARFYLNEAEIRFEKTGCRRGLAEVWNTRGELARSGGDLEAAEEAYIEANIRYESCASDLTKFAKLNLGITYLEGKKFKQAKAILTEVEKSLGGGKSPAVLLVLQLTRTICFIHEQDWDRVEHDLSRIGPGITQAGIIDTDVVGCARTAALACEEAGKMDLARKAWSIAQRQLEALGRTEEAQEAAKRSGLTPQG
jgi:tetratricopeptide (TPR) repeat protein